MIIGTCGFGSTGSSVVTDYLCEFGNVQVLDKLEFTFVSGVDGLIDLDYHLNHPHNRTTDSIYAFHRYKERAKSILNFYKKTGEVNAEAFVDSVNRFLDNVTQVKWDWYIDERTGVFTNIFRRLGLKLVNKYESKYKRQLHCWPLKEVCFSCMPKDFEKAAIQHVNEMLVALGADFSRPIILDQPFAGNNPQAAMRFFEDSYAIVVDRDPRDNYVFANTKLIGKLPHFMPIQPVDDFVTYYRSLRENQPYKQENERVISFQFEDFVYHYEETTARLRNFLHLGENPNPKSIFDPSISMPNTQVWKRFPQFAKDIEYIERELPEFLFDYTGCPEPDPNGEMFMGQSPKHK